jgi:hypothetical protein
LSEKAANAGPGGMICSVELLWSCEVDNNSTEQIKGWVGCGHPDYEAMGRSAGWRLIQPTSWATPHPEKGSRGLRWVLSAVA